MLLFNSFPTMYDTIWVQISQVWVNGWFVWKNRHFRTKSGQVKTEWLSLMLSFLHIIQNVDWMLGTSRLLSISAFHWYQLCRVFNMSSIYFNHESPKTFSQVQNLQNWKLFGFIYFWATFSMIFKHWSHLPESRDQHGSNSTME